MIMSPTKLKGRTRTAKKIQRSINLDNIHEENTEEVDFDYLVKREYERLLRQYRLREDERQSVIKKGNVLTKQAKLLDLLNNEIKNLQTDIYNVDSNKNRTRDNKSKATILTLIEAYEKAIEEQARDIKKIKEMSLHVDRIVKSLVEHNLKVQAIYGQSPTYAQIEKKRRILKDRLYFYTTRLCMKIHENQVIHRDDIPVSLKLRTFFYKRHTYLKHQLYKIRNEMSEIVFLATQSYTQQEEILASIQLLHEKNSKDNRQHVVEMMEFKRALNNDSLLREFNQTKANPRSICETLKQRSDRHYRDKLEFLDRKLNKYIQSLNFILKKSSFSTMEKLIQNYNDILYKQFALFRNNCDLNDEIMILRDTTIEMSHSLQVMYQEFEHRKLEQDFDIEKVEDKKSACEIELDQLDLMLTKAEMNLEEIFPILDALFTKIGCSRDSFGRLLANPKGIHAFNSIFCIQLIESRISDMSMKIKALEKRSRDFGNTIQRMKGRQTLDIGLDEKINTRCSGGPFIPNVIVPTNMEGAADEEDEDINRRPIPFAELKSTMLERLLLRHAQGSPNMTSRPSVSSHKQINLNVKKRVT